MVRGAGNCTKQEVSMDLITSSAMHTMKLSMDGLLQRHEAISSNIANAMTPGYKRQEVSFEGQLNEMLADHKNKEYLTVCASVDTIPGAPRSSKLPSEEEIAKSAEGTWKNFLYMRSKMDDQDKLLWTFHAGEPWEFLERALEYKDERGPINYIAFGGLVGKSSEIINTFCSKAFEIIYKHKRTDLQIHAFGMTRLALLEEYPFTSCDSTSWLQTANFGSITIGSKNVCISDRKLLSDDNIVNKSTAVIENIEKIVTEKGFTIDQLLEDSNARLMFNVLNSYEWSLNRKCNYRPIVKIDLW